MTSKWRNPTTRWVIELVIITAGAFVLTILIQQFIARSRDERNRRSRPEAWGRPLVPEPVIVSDAPGGTVAHQPEEHLRQVVVNERESGSLLEPRPIAVDDSPPAAAAKRRNSTLRWIVEVVVIVAAAFVLALLVQQFIVKPFEIPSPSMEPTLMEGDRVLVNRLVYHFRSPHVGDVVVFHPPGGSGSDPFIKRVVAVGGDTIAVHDGYLYVNGVRQSEPFIKEHPIVGDFPLTKIPQGYVWVMGDNRNNSGDSRVFGPVSVKAIMGEAFAVYWPLGRIRGL